MVGVINVYEGMGRVINVWWSFFLILLLRALTMGSKESGAVSNRQPPPNCGSRVVDSRDSRAGCEKALAWRRWYKTWVCLIIVLRILLLGHLQRQEPEIEKEGTVWSGCSHQLPPHLQSRIVDNRVGLEKAAACKRQDPETRTWRQGCNPHSF